MMHNSILAVILCAVISYLIGSINFSILLSKIIGGKDIRESGSGNAGATNMLRTYGKKLGVITLLLDVLKGVIAILITLAVTAALVNETMTYFDMISYVSGVCVILGHNFPLYFGFKGGKGVATSLGVVLMLDWKVGLIVAVIAVAVMALTRYVSLGSIIGGFLYIVLGVIHKSMGLIRFSDGEMPYLAVQIICVAIIGGLLIARHHANIKRLLSGTENKLGQKKKA